MQFLIQPNFDRYPDFIVPERATAQAAGFDLFAQEDMTISSETRLFDLGFRALVPKDHVAVILPRSGLGAKFQMQLSNTAGIIDADYTGEWKAALHIGGKGTLANDTVHYWGGSDPQHYIEVKRGEAFAQVLFLPVPKIEVEITREPLPETERGDGGFGSTTKARG